MLGDLERSAGNHDTAAEHYERALACLKRTGATGTIPSVQQNLGYVALSKGELRRAMQLFRDSLDAFARQGDERGMADGLTGLACALAAWGRSLDAAHLLGRADAIRNEMGAAIWPVNAEHYQRCVATLRVALGEARLPGAMEEGAAGSTDAVLRAALPDDAPPGELAADSPLSPRELEVAALVARGMTNRQIATELFITEGTARLHVKHILQKLDFTSRAQIAAWVAQR
jgi:non-specific serine/threonine protein kinase